MAQVSRLEKKLATCLENREYYEAHQIYRTMYYRMISAEKYQELLKLLFDGTVSFIAVNEVQSGVDLAELFADTLVKSKTPPNDAIYDQITRILKDLTAKVSGGESNGRNSVLDGRNKFVSDSITWSKTFSTKRREQIRGLSYFHYRIAKAFWEVKDYEGARSHMLLAENPESFSSLLIEMHTDLGEPAEIDLFITLAVLQLLCLHRVRTASQLFTQYLHKHPALKFGDPPYPLPLLNFCHQLIRILPRRNVVSYRLLLEKYQDVINREPSYSAYLTKISHIFMNMPEQRSGGLLGNLFKGLIGDEKKEKEEFSESDFEEEDATMDHDGDEGEDGFTTADEDEYSPPKAAPAPKSNSSVVDQMDDLD